MPQSPFRIGPGQTPRPVKFLVWTYLGTSVAITLVSELFGRFFGFYTPDRLLSLNLWGMEKFFLWQLLSYPLVTPGSISFVFALYLLFMAYILWIVCTGIAEHAGIKPLFRLIVTTTLVAGIVGAATMIGLDHPSPLSGPTGPLYGILMAWMMINPNLQVLLFMAFPIRVKWLVTILLGLNFVTNLAQAEWPVVFAYLSSLIVGYVYAMLAWNLRSPFAFTHRFDDWVADFGVRWRSRAHQKSRSKIVDFRTGKAVKDDARFMDEMLDKIAKHGEASLTRKERRRMQRISKR